MSSCPFCAKEINANAAQCPSCGKQLPGPFPANGGDVPPVQSSKSSAKKWVIIGCGGCGFFLLVLICLASVILPMVNKAKQAAQRYDRAHRNEQFLDSGEPLIEKKSDTSEEDSDSGGGPGALSPATTAPPAQAADTDAVVAALEKLGAKIKRNGQGEIVEVKLSGTDSTDGDLVHLKGLTKLQRLNLNGTQITDVGLEHLTGLTKLTFLALVATQVTNAGLMHLKGLTKLPGQYLKGCFYEGCGVWPRSSIN